MSLARREGFIVPELLHLVPDLLEKLYELQPLFFHALVTFPLTFVVIISPVCMVHIIFKERRRERKLRQFIESLLRREQPSLTQEEFAVRTRMAMDSVIPTWRNYAGWVKVFSVVVLVATIAGYLGSIAVLWWIYTTHWKW